MNPARLLLRVAATIGNRLLGGIDQRVCELSNRLGGGDDE